MDINSNTFAESRDTNAAETENIALNNLFQKKGQAAIGMTREFDSTFNNVESMRENCKRAGLLPESTDKYIANTVFKNERIRNAIQQYEIAEAQKWAMESNGRRLDKENTIRNQQNFAEIQAIESQYGKDSGALKQRIDLIEQAYKNSVMDLGPLSHEALIEKADKTAEENGGESWHDGERTWKAAREYLIKQYATVKNNSIAMIEVERQRKLDDLSERYVTKELEQDAISSMKHYLSVGYDEESAKNLANLDVKKSVQTRLAGLYTTNPTMADGILRRFEARDARAVWFAKDFTVKDKDGNEVKDENGNVLVERKFIDPRTGEVVAGNRRVQDMGKYNPLGTAFMTDDEVRTERKKLTDAEKYKQEQVKLKNETISSAVKSDVVALRSYGNQICDKVNLDGDKLDEVIAQLNSIAAKYGEKSANEAVEHLMSLKKQHLRVVSKASDIAKKLKSKDQLDAMWETYDSSKTEAFANIVFSSGESGYTGLVDAKKVMAESIRSALTNGIIKNDASTEATWKTRLKQLEEDSANENRIEMLTALKECGFSVDRNKTISEAAGKDESGIMTFVNSFGRGGEIPLAQTIDFDSSGRLVPVKIGINYTYTDENGTQWRVSSKTLQTILDSLDSRSQWNKSKATVNVGIDGRTDIRKIIKQALATKEVRADNTIFFHIFGDRWINGAALQNRLTELTLGDIEDDSLTMDEIRTRSVRDFMHVEFK